MKIRGKRYTRAHRLAPTTAQRPHCHGSPPLCARSPCVLEQTWHLLVVLFYCRPNDGTRGPCSHIYISNMQTFLYGPEHFGWFGARADTDTITCVRLMLTWFHSWQFNTVLGLWHHNSTRFVECSFEKLCARSLLQCVPHLRFSLVNTSTVFYWIQVLSEGIDTIIIW